MNDELARALERRRQLKATIRHERAGSTGRFAGALATGAGVLVSGDRVFDPITGLEGVVEHAARINIIVPPPDR